jgi:hypothetical protein
MKPSEIKIPKNFVFKTDEIRNNMIRDMFRVNEVKKNEPKNKN